MTPRNFDALTRFFHWSMAFFIISLLIVGFYMTDLEPSPFKLEIYTWHKSFGFLLIPLLFFRIIWRLMTTDPKFEGDRILYFLSRINILFLYALMMTITLSGFIMSDTGGYGVNLFGILPLPFLFEKNPELAMIARMIHGYGVYIISGLIALHVCAALFHHFILGDRTLKKMLRP